jgi:hypothetical protein
MANAKATKYVHWFYGALDDLKAGRIDADKFRGLLIHRWGYDEDEASAKMAELAHQAH